MSQHLIPHNHLVTTQLLQGFEFGTYTALSQAREILGGMLRASMANTDYYAVPIDAFPTAEGQTFASLAAGIHPYNIAVALLRVCSAGPAMGGAALAPQTDLYVHLAGWVPVAECAFDEPVPEAVPAQVVEAAAQPATDNAVTAPTAHAEPIQQQPDEPVVERAPPKVLGLPYPTLELHSSSRPGRPVKSLFEKEHTPRKSIGAAPFWWQEMAPRWSRMFTESPGQVVGRESSGSAPLVAYTAMVHTLQLALANVPANVTAEQLREHLGEIRENIAQSPSAPVAFTLIDHIFSK